MKFGICCPAGSAREMIDAGFDYAEVGAADLPSHVESLMGLSLEATNLFFPGDLRIFEPKAGDPFAHARTVIQAAAELGVKVMVIGSGRQRAHGPETAANEALDTFVSLVAEIQSIAGDYGIKMAPESLNRSETNVGNDLHSLAEALNTKGVGYTADSYHVFQERRYMAAIDWAHEVPFAPLHVHLGDKPRHVPKPNDWEVHAFFSRLRTLGYDERISFEGDLQGMSPHDALQKIRALWSRSEL